jgi:predicted glycoside hydrolase/deacetylase ChbG (UPF0249 family)
MASQRILAHLDDVGSSAGSVVAWKALREAGVVRSASVMVPCPWYRAAVEDWHGAPDQDLGVHLTLTSQWQTYRWRPLIGPVKGLTDDEGYFHHRPDAVVRNADPAAVADEIAAQIERALTDGIKPTHLDAHMGTVFLEPFIDALLGASQRYGIPVLICRDLSALAGDVTMEIPDTGYLEEAMGELERRGNPVFDKFLIEFCPDDRDARSHYSDLIANAGPGFHWLALHANAPDDMARFAPHHAEPRRKEFEFFGSPDSREIFDANDSVTVDWREMT